MSYRNNWLAITLAGGMLILIDASTWALSTWVACVAIAAAVTVAAHRHT